MRSGVPHLLFLVAFVVNCILWSNSRYAHLPARGAAHSALTKRNLYQVETSLGLEHGNATLLSRDDQCHPRTLPVELQCTNIQQECPKPHTVLSISYSQRYYCADPSVRPVIFSGYVLWLLFLFSTLGISASDFFCPNLGTLAQVLGLDENVAGVTFLAFGNGSPDLFATFSAMREDSGGLAIGELLGAASFVTSCVVGSMCIIKPFRVDRTPFLRDVGFFTLAVILLLIILWDSKIEAWEAESLVALYFFYVLVVVIGSWWERRRERHRQQEELMRDEYREDTLADGTFHQEPYRDEPHLTHSDTLQVPYVRNRTISSPGPPRLGLELPVRPHTRDSSPHSFTPRSPSPHISHMPSFSLVGALEFRRVVSSLQDQSAGSRLSLFESPVAPYPGGHYNHHRYYSQSSQHSRTPLPSEAERERYPWDITLGVPLEQRSPQVIIDDIDSGDNILIPTIAHTPASPSLNGSETETETEHYVPLSRRQRFVRFLGTICRVLFPTLQNFRSKSILGMVAAVLAAPAVTALTLTLPVVVTDYEGVSDAAEKLENTARLVDFEEEGVARTLIAEEEVQNEMHELKYNKWLMAVQCTLGPLFCLAILFAGMKHEPWLLLSAGVAGTTVGILVAVFGGTGASPAALLARCTMGFIVAIVWIMAIADEVVEVLQTFGLIFGLSDAIIGLTIFAMGNSIADLVANMSVAVFAPIMGFSACFGGPMLNILLGIGVTGTYITRQTSEHYPLHFSTTLVITGTGLLVCLLATLIFVPWNNYFLPRSWGITLIVAYSLLMIANVIVEVKTNTSSS